MSFEAKLDKILEKHTATEAKLSEVGGVIGPDYVKMMKELSDLTELIERIKIYRKAQEDIKDLETFTASLEANKDQPDTDKEMRDIAQQELIDLKKILPEQEHQLKMALLPKDEADARNAILEVRAGTGGQEAALFAAELFEMYLKYADRMGWKSEVLSISDTGIGGYKEASAIFSGKNVFARLKFESGVHRIQRVPATEACGRIHTSAATVAILPEAEEIDVQLLDKDLRIDVFRSSGAGGQSVNTTDSAVRVTHIPTGLVVSQQDERSQHKNKAKALKVMRSRLYEMKRQQQETERATSRKSQVGSGDRGERIRTYNFPQSRVTDHRINLTLYKLDAIVNEGDLDELVDSLTADYEARRLSEEL